MTRYDAYKSVLPGFVYLTRYSEANDANVPAPEGEYYLASDVAELERRYREAVKLLRKVEETMRLGCYHDLVRNNIELINAFLIEEDA